MEYFKNDALENKFIDSANTLFSYVDAEIDTMESEVYECYKLGEMLYDNNWMPLVNAITRRIFTRCFTQVFESWSRCGTFESYISVMQKIFGETATIVFTIPGAGQLNVDVSTSEIEVFNFIAREIVDDAWIYNNIVDYSGDNILFVNPYGIESQYELEKVFGTMAPNGIFTTVTLTIV